jgi:hypothetical protein
MFGINITFIKIRVSNRNLTRFIQTYKLQCHFLLEPIVIVNFLTKSQVIKV